MDPTIGNFQVFGRKATGLHALTTHTTAGRPSQMYRS
jgi:hypothetical protein